MKFRIKDTEQPPRPRASVAEGTLVLSLPDARTPVVWRVALDKVQNAALEVRRDGDNAYVLVMKNPPDGSEDIAHYTTRDEAVRALMVIAEAMEQEHIAGRPGPPHGVEAPSAEQGASRLHVGPAHTMPVHQSQNTRKGPGGWLVTLIALLVIGALVYAVANTGPQTVRLSGNDAGQAQAGPDSTGVPMSADDYLNR